MSEEPSEETKERWHSDPDNWVWGMFYYNKLDKRIFPPKRIKYMGWTVNFANPVSMLVLIGMILVFGLLFTVWGTK